MNFLEHQIKYPELYISKEEWEKDKELYPLCLVHLLKDYDQTPK